MANKTILMTNGTQTVPVVRSAFIRSWSRLGWKVADPGAVETERILNLEEGETIEHWKEREAARLAELAKADEDQQAALAALAEYDKAVAAGTSIDDASTSTAVTTGVPAAEQAPPSQGPFTKNVKSGGDSTGAGDSTSSNPPATS